MGLALAKFKRIKERILRRFESPRAPSDLPQMPQQSSEEEFHPSYWRHAQGGRQVRALAQTRERNLVLPKAEAQKGNIQVKVRSINSEGKGNRKYVDAEDDISEPPPISV